MLKLFLQQILGCKISPIMMKSRVKKWIHRLILPRGTKYISKPELEIGWSKGVITHENKNICYIHYPSDSNRSPGLVILSHPYLADAKTFFLIRGQAEMYINHLFDVVIFDYNGFGESPFCDFNYAEDLEMVATYFHKHNPDVPIFGHGISFGASHTITYSTSDHNKFSKIIIENCLDSNLSYYKKRNRKLHYLMLAIMRIMPSVNRDHSYVKSISKLKGINKVLLIYNIHDDLTTIEMGRKLLSACNAPSKMITFSGAHLQAYEKNKLDYQKEIMSFLIDITI